MLTVCVSVSTNQHTVDYPIKVVNFFYHTNERGSEGVNPAPQEQDLLLPKCRRDAAISKRMGCFAVCGRRLKALP